MLSIKVSSKYQVSLPSEARRRLGIEAGDRLSVEIIDETLVLRRRPARASERLWGLGRGMYGPDPVTFVRGVREELEDDLDEREHVVARGAGRAPRARRD